MLMPPRTKAASFMSSWCRGMLVWIPSITISESAMRMRAIACSRVSPWAISLPMSES